MLERITYRDPRNRARVRVFVYGTLVSGGPNHEQYLRQKGHDSEYIGAYTTKGELWVWGALPFMIPATPIIQSEDTVFGEIWGVDMHTLARLDRLEGIEPTHKPSFEWYAHQVVRCEDIINGEITSALTYVFQIVPRALKMSCIKLPQGDYLEWLREEQKVLQQEMK